MAGISENEEEVDVELLLLGFIKGDCHAAAWAFVAGDTALGEKLLVRASEFLELLNGRRGALPWRTLLPHGSERVG
jgi:hypothetical protein